ncbi:MAG: xanthine dehydrogenase family protein subunit M [Thermodesulfobacteriota bacterium]|nr:xanthine dehydrogenase family protein subunit M [Thermodesulfobacteriota bacterium]
MLITLPEFDYFSCRTLAEACSLLAAHKDEARVLAGGTDLLIKMKHKKMTPQYLIDIKRVPDLNYIRHDEDEGLRIGALTTIQAIRNSSLIKKKFSVLSQAASVLGTRQVRNLATLGGNLCNASPAAESAPALLTLEANVKIEGPGGKRILPVEEFFLGPDMNALEHGEILTEIQFPDTPIHTGGVYFKHSTRRIDVSIVGVAVLITLDGQACQDIRIALGAVGPTPFRARKAEKVLKGQKLSEETYKKAAQVASEESFPIDDIRGYADYRKKMVETLVREGIEGAVAGVGS